MHDSMRDYYFYNTDADSLVGPPRRFHRLIEQHFAATGGPLRFGKELSRLKEGDTLLMYENGMGIVAVGRVLERWDGKSHEDLLYYQPNDIWTEGEGREREYRIMVDWDYDLSGNPISVQELGRRLGYTPSGHAVQKIRERRAEAEAIVAEVRSGAAPIREATDLRIPDRVAATTLRIIRDTKWTRRVKMLHDHKCQVCGHTINLSDGSGYAEGHHIQPLGAPHNGPDVMGNILCACPNHHAELDYGAIPILLAALRNCPGHTVEQKYVDYHNHKIYGAKGKK